MIVVSLELLVSKFNLFLFFKETRELSSTHLTQTDTKYK